MQVLLAHPGAIESYMMRRTTRKTRVQLMTMMIRMTLKVGMLAMRGAALVKLMCVGNGTFVNIGNVRTDTAAGRGATHNPAAKSPYQSFKDSEKQILERFSIPDPLLPLCDVCSGNYRYDCRRMHYNSCKRMSLRSCMTGRDRQESVQRNLFGCWMRERVLCTFSKIC